MATTTITAYLTDDDVATAYRTTIATPGGELVQLLDDPITPKGTLNTDLLAQLITRVNGLMDSKISVRYALPLTVDAADADRVAETLLGCALAMFRWLILADKQHSDEAFKPLKSGYDDAMKWLGDVGAGRANLGTSKPVPGAEVRTADVSTDAPERKFSRDRLSGW